MRLRQIRRRASQHLDLLLQEPVALTLSALAKNWSVSLFEI
jgi:hypothetical protein